ncbi:MAG TPA: ABC transporter substrate-binding protein [Clostridiales bacterium]|nr:ABC transporter substrate-binding protein [Clostridiales bacterium]
MKKIISILLIIVMMFSIAIFSSSCGNRGKDDGSTKSGSLSDKSPSSSTVSSSADSTSSTNSAVSKEPVSLTFLRIGNDAPEAEYWKSLIKDFEEKNTNIKIQYDDAAIGEPMETKLNTLFAGGAGPDIIGHGILSVANRVEAGHYTPISEYFSKWDGKEDIMESVLANGTYKGEVYGLAYSTTPFVFAYRKDMFKDAGLDPEKPPQTWDELKDYAKRLTVKTGDRITRAGFAFPMAAGNFVEFDVFVFGNGGRFYDENNMPTINTPEKAEVFEFLKGFIDEVNIPYNSNEVNPFIKGNAAMTLINNVALRPVLADPELKDKIGVAVPPYNKKKATFSGCNMLFIGGDCKNKDEAWKFIEAALTKEQIIERSKKLNIPVTRKSLIDEFAKLDPYNAVRAECVSAGIGMPRTTWSPRFQAIRNEMVQKVLYSKASIQEALTEAQNKLMEEIK